MHLYSADLQSVEHMLTAMREDKTVAVRDEAYYVKSVERMNALGELAIYKIVFVPEHELFTFNAGRG